MQANSRAGFRGRMREVKLSIERCAWGSFSTGFYPTYDIRPVWEEIKSKSAAPS